VESQGPGQRGEFGIRTGEKKTASNKQKGHFFQGESSSEKEGERGDFVTGVRNNVRDCWEEGGEEVPSLLFYTLGGRTKKGMKESNLLSRGVPWKGERGEPVKNTGRVKTG